MTSRLSLWMQYPLLAWLYSLVARPVIRDKSGNETMQKTKTGNEIMQEAETGNETEE